MVAKLGPFTCQEEVKLRVTLVTPYNDDKDWVGTLLALASGDHPAEEIEDVLDEVGRKKEDPNVHAYGVF